MMKKKKFYSVMVTLLLLLTFSSQAFATEKITPMSEPIDNMTTEFSRLTRDNAAWMAYYAYNDSQQGTYPIGTGFEFAERVKPGGVWDYKKTYGYSAKYYFHGIVTTGEDFGNVHYAYVGRAAGFGELLLKSAAGAVQIYAGTSSIKWYASFFDDPKDQAAIQRGLDYWTNKNLPNPNTFKVTPEVQSLIDSLSEGEKAEIRDQAKKVSDKIKNGEIK